MNINFQSWALFEVINPELLRSIDAIDNFVRPMISPDFLAGRGARRSDRELEVINAALRLHDHRITVACQLLVRDRRPEWACAERWIRLATGSALYREWGRVFEQAAQIRQLLRQQESGVIESRIHRDCVKQK